MATSNTAPQQHSASWTNNIGSQNNDTSERHSWQQRSDSGCYRCQHHSTKVQLLATVEFDIKKEAAWAISNATSGFRHEQIKYLVNQGCIKPLCDLLTCQDARIVTVSLGGLDNILKVGEAEKDRGSTGSINLYARYIDEAEGLEKIENLQTHDNNEIYEKVVIKDFGDIMFGG
ncbi:unnamed protein product [Calypogeia fissa]